MNTERKKDVLAHCNQKKSKVNWHDTILYPTHGQKPKKVWIPSIGTDADGTANWYNYFGDQFSNNRKSQYCAYLQLSICSLSCYPG